MTLIESLFLGMIEGFTEFLPVSSTGHLILASSLLGLEQTAVHKAYEVAIQLGSILAVLFAYKERLTQGFSLWFKLAVAFVPTGALGFLLYKHIKALFAPETVAVMLILGGFVFIITELLHKEKEEHVGDLDDVSYKQAFFIGLAQSLAMIPGTSRSGATILGGIFLGLKRKTAVEFSFLLALPTMLIATAYDVTKNFEHFAFDDWGNLAVGFVSAFLFALVAIRFFLAFISKFNLIPFGVYRIVLGTVFITWFL